MDEHYDDKKAKTILNTYIDLANAREINGSETSSKQLTHVKVDEYIVTESSQPTCWRLTIPATDTTASEEVTFRMQGIVTDKVLPPIGKPMVHKAERMRPHMRQALTISGLGIPSFDKAIDNMEKIQIAFMTSLGDNEVTPLQPASFQGSFAIDAHNKYFTRRHLAAGQEIHPFHQTTDPDGVLASLQNYEYVHIEDNHVDYLGPTHVAGVTKIGPISPATISVGDIVEIGVSFVAIPVGKNKMRLIASLRSIRILDRDCRNNAAILAMRAKYTHKTTTNPKRKATYSDEELAGMSSKLAKMGMDESSG